MFQHADLQENREGKLRLDGDTNVTPAVVNQFLKFIYTDSISDNSFGTISHLLPLAEKYNIKKLSTLCGESLLTSMSIDNVSEIAVLGSLYEVPLLRTKAIEYISQYPERVMKTEGWKELLKLSPEVCTAIIYRLSRVGTDKEVVVKSGTRSSLSN